MDTHQDADPGARSKTRTYLLIAAIPVAITALVVVVGTTVIQPPPGPPLATLDIKSGEPFELSFVSDGNALRIWVDMQCDRCALPLEGTIAVYRGDRELDANKVMAGDTRDRAWGGTSRRLVQHPIFEVDAQPAGTEMTVRGSLRVGTPEKDEPEAPTAETPSPQVKLLRVTVTP